MSRFEIPADLGRVLDPIHEALDDPAPLRHAAVLGLILGELDDARLLLIERSQALSSHAGQLAFPGGKPEPGDESLLDTALREAEEEVGLVRDDVRVLGRLSPVPTPTGFMIVPFVARAGREWTARKQSPEVRTILEPSFAELVNPSVYRYVGEANWKGRKFGMHEWAIHDPPLWGATARMLWDLLQRMGVDPRDPR